MFAQNWNNFDPTKKKLQKSTEAIDTVSSDWENSNRSDGLYISVLFSTPAIGIRMGYRAPCPTSSGVSESKMYVQELLKGKKLFGPIVHNFERKG